MSNLLLYSVIFLVGFVATYLLTPLVRRGAVRIGMIDVPDSRRIHQSPTPNAGGLAIFSGFQLVCAMVFMNPWHVADGILNSHWWQSFFMASSLLLIVGIVDDASHLHPLVKLGGQIVVAVVSFAFGMRAGYVLGVDLPLIIDLLITVLWILTFVNAFNLIDGIDGLATGLAAIASLGLAGALLFRHLPGDALVMFGLCGCCVAFLCFNFYPAKIFLGDSGSMFLGYALATVSLGTGSKGTAMASIGVPLLAVGVPIFDTILAMWRRSIRGATDDPAGGFETPRVMRADLDHIHHRLLRSGLSQDRVAVWLYGANALLVVVGLASLSYRSNALGIYLIAFVAASYVIVRHVARTELWDTGFAILSGLHKPTSKVRAVLTYPLLDAVLLAAALALAMALARATGPHRESAEFGRAWLDSIPIHVGVPFVTLVMMRTYNRVWSRARISEYSLLNLSLVGGIFLGCGLVILMKPAVDSRTVIVQSALYLGLAMPLLTGSRAFLRTMQDWVAINHQIAPDRNIPGVRNTLVYGAGARGILFVERNSDVTVNGETRRRIVGFVDDDRNLRKRLVHGHEVFGGVQELPDVIVRFAVNEIVIAAELTEEARNILQNLAWERQIVLSNWEVHETVLYQPQAKEENYETRERRENDRLKAELRTGNPLRINDQNP